MSSESPPAKRAQKITRSTESWFGDGNVVLQAQNTQFRVHWGILAHNSLVFRQMQGLPQPPDSEQSSVEGCPVVEIYDEAEDVGYLMNALYTPTFLSTKKLSLPVVGALIRLGRKYEFKDLLDSAVARVAAECPTTLQQLDASSDGYATIKWYPGIEIDMVALVSENNIWSSLPSACYDAVFRSYTVGDLFDGMLRRDGTRASLSPANLRRCLIGREKFMIKQFETGYAFGWTRKWEFTDCTSPVMCFKMREDILEQFKKKPQICALCKMDWLGFIKLCTACTRHATESVAAGRQKIWEELPQIFDLPHWNELKNDL
ncbi:hypothetical protein C8R45DRAFT_885318 [Mycena sanguinolenta]|nr:hypothetical protein C8R45DRAFT_885318 [Mycena sanguinolenta]